MNRNRCSLINFCSRKFRNRIGTTVMVSVLSSSVIVLRHTLFSFWYYSRWWIRSESQYDECQKNFVKYERQFFHRNKDGYLIILSSTSHIEFYNEQLKRSSSISNSKQKRLWDDLTRDSRTEKGWHWWWLILSFFISFRNLDIMICTSSTWQTWLSNTFDRRY